MSSKQQEIGDQLDGVSEHRQTDHQQIEWLDDLIWKMPASNYYPDLTKRCRDIICEHWFARFPKKLWSKLITKTIQGPVPRVIKELNEILPVLHRVVAYVEGHTCRDAETGEFLKMRGDDQRPFSIVDAGCGIGYMSMLLSSLLSPQQARYIYLVDKMWPASNIPETWHDGKHISRDHIDVIPECWPIPLWPLKVDLKSGRGLSDLVHYIFRNNSKSKKSESASCTTAKEELVTPSDPKVGCPPAPIQDSDASKPSQLQDNINPSPRQAPTKNEPNRIILLGVHLCGSLSLRMVDMINSNPDVVEFACIKPCCLPGKQHLSTQMTYKVGDHAFTAEELYYPPGVPRPLKKRERRSKRDATKQGENRDDDGQEKDVENVEADKIESDLSIMPIGGHEQSGSASKLPLTRTDEQEVERPGTLQKSKENASDTAFASDVRPGELVIGGATNNWENEGKEEDLADEDQQAAAEDGVPGAGNNNPAVNVGFGKRRFDNWCDQIFACFQLHEEELYCLLAQDGVAAAEKTDQDTNASEEREEGEIAHSKMNDDSHAAKTKLGRMLSDADAWMPREKVLEFCSNLSPASQSSNHAESSGESNSTIRSAVESFKLSKNTRISQETIRVQNSHFQNRFLFIEREGSAFQKGNWIGSMRRKVELTENASFEEAYRSQILFPKRVGKPRAPGEGRRNAARKKDKQKGKGQQAGKTPTAESGERTEKKTSE